MPQCYILAELLKRNTLLHGIALKKEGRCDKWPGEAAKVINAELRNHPLKCDSKIKAFSGHLWGWLRLNDITTRQIYQLLLQWMLYLTEQKLMVFYTNAYSDLADELLYTIESGAEGTTEIDAEEIIEEWEFVKNNYYSVLNNICEKWIKENCK